MTANCASIRGEQSTLAPTSMTTTGWPASVGKTPARAGRSTPCTTPCTILAVAMTAPVLPAETRPWAAPSRTSREPTRSELSRLLRTARAALSSMVTCSLACRISRASSRRTTSSLPTRMTLTPRVLAARTAPSTSDVGALSPPMASTAMVTMTGPGDLFLRDFDDFAPLVLAAMRADPVRQFGLVAVGTFRQAGGLQAVMGPAVLSAPVGVTSFRIRHASTSKNITRLRGKLPNTCEGKRVKPPTRLPVAQGSPAVVRWCHPAIAGCLVAVGAADRTNPLTILFAGALHRQQKQDLLTKDVLEFHASPLVEANLDFAFLQADFFFAFNIGDRPVKQIERRFEHKARAPQAAVARTFHGHRQTAAHPDFTGSVG